MLETTLHCSDWSQDEEVREVLEELEVMEHLMREELMEAMEEMVFLCKSSDY